MTDDEWLERMRDIYDGDVAEAFDSVGLHPYTRKGRVKRWWDRFSDWLVRNL